MGIYRAMHSSLFYIEVIEVTDNRDLVGVPVPMDEKSIQSLAGLSLGRESLLKLDLYDIETKITAHPWIESAAISKRLPETLAISIQYRRPVALVQKKNGSLTYLDAKNVEFGSYDFSYRSELPVMSGTDPLDKEFLLVMIRLIRNWQHLGLNEWVRLSAISRDPKKGYVATVVYGKTGQLRRSQIEFGQKIDTSFYLVGYRLKKVFEYLVSHSLKTSAVVLASEKKIVVKTDLSS